MSDKFSSVEIEIARRIMIAYQNALVVGHFRNGPPKRPLQEPYPADAPQPDVDDDDWPVIEPLPEGPQPPPSDDDEEFLEQP